MKRQVFDDYINRFNARDATAFDDITLYRHESAAPVWYQVTELSPLQRRILQLMQVPESVYAPPATLIDSG